MGSPYKDKSPLITQESSSLIVKSTISPAQVLNLEHEVSAEFSKSFIAPRCKRRTRAST